MQVMYPRGVRTTVAIDDRLLGAAKQRARETGQTLGQVVEEALRLSLVAKTATTPPVLPVFTRGTGLRAGIDPASNRSLFDALDDAGDLR